MGSDIRRVRGEAQKELVKKFEVFTSKGRSRWQVWSDWITISAIAVSNATDKNHFDERERQYMTIVKKYTKQETDTFADMLSLLVMALEDDPEQDFLGELYMCLGLGNDHAGQFFTPYHLCEFTSAVTTPAEEFQQKIGDRGWVAVCDPTCGAGALLVAFANECRKKGINYQTDVLFVAQDIDYIVGMMCYLQMSLLGMPGYRVAGIEMQIGAYVEQLDPLWKASLVDDDHWHYDVFSCKSGEKQVGSISSDYAQTGSFDLNDKATWSWHYIRKLGKLGAEAMMYEKFNGSGSTYVRAAFLSPSSAGVHAPWRGGTLVDGALCGLPCASGTYGPGAASWHGVPRLAGSGKKRG